MTYPTYVYTCRRIYYHFPGDAARLPRASQKSKVKKTSQSYKMKAIKKHFHGGETRHGLYNTRGFEQSGPRAAPEADAIALQGLPAGGRWASGAWETL